jgi:hypothetical protein
MTLSYCLTGEFLHIATANVFNVVALLSAVLLLLDPILFLVHSGYNYYLHLQAEKAEAEKRAGKPPSEQSRNRPKDHLNATPEWWKWYLAAFVIHFFDAWFFRTIIPFFERARAQRDLPTNDLQDLADISRLMWGIIRSLSLFVIGIEVWEKRLVLVTVLGTKWKNPKWGFAVLYFLAPTIVAVAVSPVVLYFVLLGVWNSGGFFWGVIKEAFTPDWRSSQDVFVKTATETVTTTVGTATASPKAPAWAFLTQFRG